MTITAKYQGRCAHCGQAITPGQQIEWTRDQPARHASCTRQTGAEILAQIVDRRSAHGRLLPLSGYDAQLIGEVDEATVARWQAQAASVTPEQRAQVAAKLRKALMAEQLQGAPNLATLAALIDMLEA
jgi:hypothetical protein